MLLRLIDGGGGWDDLHWLWQLDADTTGTRLQPHLPLCLARRQIKRSLADRVVDRPSSSEASVGTREAT